VKITHRRGGDSKRRKAYGIRRFCGREGRRHGDDGHDSEEDHQEQKSAFFFVHFLFFVRVGVVTLIEGCEDSCDTEQEGHESHDVQVVALFSIILLDGLTAVHVQTADIEFLLSERNANVDLPDVLQNKMQKRDVRVEKRFKESEKIEQGKVERRGR
jgi:hypothetical protein